MTSHYIRTTYLPQENVKMSSLTPILTPILKPLTSPKEALKEIISSGKLKRQNPWGIAAKHRLSEEDYNKQKCVCFTETPLEFLWALCEDIKRRRHQLSTFGIIITKKQARERCINPVWYIDGTEGHGRLDETINNLIKETEKSSKLFDLTPFFEVMSSWKDKKTNETRRKEFWWEREWRCNRDFTLPDNFITVCPENDHTEIRDVIKKRNGISHLIDSQWSMEQIVAHLANFDPDEIGPF